MTGGVLPGWTTINTCMSYDAFKKNMVIINLFVLVRVTSVNVFDLCRKLICAIFYIVLRHGIPVRHFF